MFMLRSTRSAAFWVVVTLAFLAQTVVAAIAIRLTTAAMPTGPIYNTALTTSVFDVCALALLLVAIGIRRLPQAHRTRAFTTVPSFLIAAVSVVLSIYTFIWAYLEASPKDARALAVGGIAAWAVATLSQSAFYMCLLWPQQHQQHGIDASEFEEAVERPSPIRSVKRSLSVHLASLTPTPPKFSWREPYSPTDSAYAISPSPPFRHSITQAVRPMGSKTRLLRRSLASGQESPSLYSESARREDGFESWDTSAIEEDFLSSPTPQRTERRLEPIPGSRPASPAKPLDGPFPLQTSPEDTPLPESPLQSPSLSSPHLDQGRDSLDNLSSLRRPSTPGQNFIHPLFRTESPMPPPMPSPGTVITASPYAGQIVGREHAFSPTRQFYGEGSRSGSVRSFRTAVGSPAMEGTAMERNLTRELSEGQTGGSEVLSEK